MYDDDTFMYDDTMYDDTYTNEEVSQQLSCDPFTGRLEDLKYVLKKQHHDGLDYLNTVD